MSAHLHSLHDGSSRMVKSIAILQVWYEWPLSAHAQIVTLELAYSRLFDLKTLFNIVEAQFNFFF